MTKGKQANHKQDIGRISSLFAGVARVTGFKSAKLHEVIVDSRGNDVGLVIGFTKDYVEVLLFDEFLDPQTPLLLSGKEFTVPINDDILGRVIDGLSKPIDMFGKLEGKRFPVFREAPAVMDREPVKVPLSTGIKIIDTNLPLGRGQRELIVGDRKLGKSTIAIDTVLNQKRVDPKVYCVYVVIGQKESQLKDLLSILDRHNAFLYTTVVAATAGSSYANQYLAPFVGTAIAEYFRDSGKDALIVYDDLSKHAKVYRDISLLLKRAPGREAYPGDVFSLHAKLLERSAKLSKKKGGGSLTALPIVETLEGDISAFIPTNIISITDGQIYLERGLFEKGFIPAVNVGLSVSRVGSAAQPDILKDVTSGIRLALAQHKQLQKLSQLETTVSDKMQKSIHRGDLILALLKQQKHTIVTPEEQTILFYAVETGLFDDIGSEHWARLETYLLDLIRGRYIRMVGKLKQGVFDEKIKDQIKELVDEFKQEFVNKET